MKLTLKRYDFTPEATFGKLFVDGVFECEVLEDFDRKLESGGEKIYGETAIPRGKYHVLITYSNRFKRDLPLLLEVPQFEGIRIHPGNTAADTLGCLLVGTARVGNTIRNSKIAFNALFQKLEAADNIEIEIS